jgi:hypothetical protein
MVFTDPPYNVRIDGNVSGLGAIHHREFAMGSGELSEAEFTAFLSRTCSLLVRHTAEGSISSAWIGDIWVSCSRPAARPTPS